MKWEMERVILGRSLSMSSSFCHRVLQRDTSNAMKDPSAHFALRHVYLVRDVRTYVGEQGKHFNRDPGTSMT